MLVPNVKFKANFNPFSQDTVYYPINVENSKMTNSFHTTCVELRIEQSKMVHEVEMGVQNIAKTRMYVVGMIGQYIGVHTYFFFKGRLKLTSSD